MSLLDLSLDHQKKMIKHLSLKDLHSLQQVCSTMYAHTWKYSIHSLVFRSNADIRSIHTYLSKVSVLNSLDLCGAKITDNVVESLKSLASLTSLYLSDTKISDEGLKNFEELIYSRVISQ